jgi:hypothetical protein
VRRSAMLLVALLIAASGCGSSTAKTTGSTVSTTSTLATTTTRPLSTIPTTVTTPTSSRATTTEITITDSDKGAKVTIRQGARLTVRLGSTYWTIQGGSNPTVLQQQGHTTYTPAPGCPPGAGCGTADASFLGLAPGQAQVTASRTSCGEALACSPAAGSYQVTVIVLAN